MSEKPLEIIGSTELVSIGGRVDVPAKVDTGADSSSIWASKIKVDKDGVLSFALFGEGSPFYNGKVFKRTDYEVAIVRSATGEEQMRYRTHLPIKIKGRTITALFNLSDRSRNNAPILIGKRTIRGKFIVDVSKSAIDFPKNRRVSGLNAELKKNPYQFYKKYQKGA